MHFRSKDCDDCGSSYTPTGARQKKCDGCRDTRLDQYYADWRERNRENLRKQSRDRSQLPAVRSRNQRNGIRWNVQQWADPNDVDEIMSKWDARDGLCAICGISEDTTGKAMAVDHCHLTHVFRGFLCHRCNTGLSWFEESADQLFKAGEYLKCRST